MSARRTLATALILLAGPVLTFAAELLPETTRAWDEYIEAVTSQTKGRAQSGKFLWVDERSDRLRRVREGEAVVAPMQEHSSKRVPHGLIHDWIGAMFIPNVHLEDVFDVVRDYGRYKEFYKPAVIDSKQLSQSGPHNYRFSMVLLNQELFTKSALETNCDASYIQVDARRWYSITQTTRVQQIDDYAQPGQQRLPVDHGSGYIWRLFSVSRFEERDGGVYVELEAIALSREIPLSLRWVVEPVVRRIAKNSLQLSL